jgi:hypothetical protein
MRVVRVAAAAAAVFLIAATPVRSQALPELNVDPVCRGIAQQAAGPGEKGDIDVAFSQCVSSERTVRQKLSDEWSTFLPSEKSTCIGSEQGGLPSYTDLISCLEMARDVRQSNAPGK